MDFRQIEAFIKVVELASFSRAAEELHISQPSISNYISSLERELDAVLINRSTKVMSTTLAGERFLEKASMIMSLKRESIETIKNLYGDVSGEIRILASSVPAQYILPKLLARFHKHYPNIAFTLNQADTSKVVQKLAEHKADLGFAGSMLGEKRCEFIEFASEELVFIAPNNGAYDEEKEYSLEELLYSDKFISREIGSGTRIQYEKFFSENEIMLDKIKTCASMDSTSSIVGAVENGLGISIVSEVAVRQAFSRKALVRLRLKVGLPERKIYMVLNRNCIHSHLVKLFMEYVMDMGDQSRSPTPLQNLDDI